MPRHLVRISVGVEDRGALMGVVERALVVAGEVDGEGRVGMNEEVLKLENGKDRKKGGA